jgi:drug/metabolite transporter (DMT)-like permease
MTTPGGTNGSRSVGAALLCVAGAAVCSGTAIVLQAVAARRLPRDTRLDAALVGGLARDPVYLLALVLVATGAALSFVALRTLPLFAVQAGRASSVAVSAILAVTFLGARLRWTDWLGITGLGAGLVVLATSVQPSEASAVGPAGTWLVVGLTVALVVGGALTALGPPSRLRGLVLAVLAGLAFAVLALGAHAATSWNLADLLSDPVIWCAAACGPLGLAMSVLALHRAPVVPVTALMVGMETVAGALLGVALTGDRPADGAVPLAVLGFVLVLVGAIVVARFGAPETAAAEATTPAT